MLITFERIWAVGRFDVGRGIFVVQQQPRAGTVANRGCFLATRGSSQPGALQSATCQKGVKSFQKGGLTKLSRDGGVYPHASIPKRGN